MTYWIYFNHPAQHAAVPTETSPTEIDATRRAKELHTVLHRANPESTGYYTVGYMDAGIIATTKGGV